MRGEKQHDVSRVKPYIPTRRAQVKQEIDRTTWADTTMVVFPVNVEGAGEYLTEEPVMFGQAFESPPFFNFSNVTAPFLAPEVRAIGWMAAGTDPTRSALQREGLIKDGSFEHQMIWDDPYIPSVMEWPDYGYMEEVPDLNFTSWQKIRHEQHGAGPLYPGHSNHWVQTGPTTGDRWEISGDNFYPNEPGYQGQYAAKFVFGAEPESPWLIPFYPEFNPWFALPEWEEETVVQMIWTMMHDGNGPNQFIPDGGYVPIVNPLLRTETFTMHAWSDGPCEIEIYFRLWADTNLTTPQSGATGLPAYNSETLQTTMMLDTQAHTLSANTWQECKSTFSIPFRVWPNFPDGDPEWIDAYQFVFWIRATGGTPGQIVYLDNGWAWPDLTTQASGLITVGVAEWIQDDKDMYIGAHLWFKTYSGVTSSEEA